MKSSQPSQKSAQPPPTEQASTEPAPTEPATERRRDPAAIGPFARNVLLGASIGAVIGIAFIASVMALNQAPAQAPAGRAGSADDIDAASQLVAAADLVPIRAANTAGSATAPVTLIEYSDFQCAYCRQFHQQVYPRLFEQYIQTGQVRFVYKQFAVLGDESRWAAQASECAGDQGRFWAYHDRLFSREVVDAGEVLNRATLARLAAQLELDTDAFDDCLQQDRTLDRVQAETAEGQRIGVRGTPSFLVNRRLLIGGQSFEAFQAAIDQALTTLATK